jgi:hypothetical protein
MECTFRETTDIEENRATIKGLPRKMQVVALLDGGIERVHVDMDNLSHEQTRTKL